MRNKFVSLQALALLVIFCLTGSLTRAAVNPKPFVVPELKQWTGKDGNFTPGKDTRIVCTSQNPELLRIARMFADDYQQMFGQTLSVAQGKATSGDFVLSLSADKKLGEEGYAIKITDRVAISAPTRPVFTGAHAHSCNWRNKIRNAHSRKERFVIIPIIRFAVS